MYMMRRVHAEQSPKGGNMNVWVMQWQRADLNELIKTARFNLNPFKEIPGGSMWEDHAPDQNKLPGCVWQGRVDENFEWNDRIVHGITHCMIFNISKCWYSSVLSRETSDFDNPFTVSTASLMMVKNTRPSQQSRNAWTTLQAQRVSAYVATKISNLWRFTNDSIIHRNLHHCRTHRLSRRTVRMGVRLRDGISLCQMVSLVEYRLHLYFDRLSYRCNCSGNFNLRSIKNHKIYINPLDNVGLIVYISQCKPKRNPLMRKT